MASDEFLIELLEVLDEHGAAIVRSLVRKGTVRAEAEDILQQVCVILLQKKDQQAIEDLKNYCYGVAHRLAAKRRQQQALRDDKLRRVAGGPPEHAPSAFDEAAHHADEEHRLNRLWEEAIETLDPVTKEVYVCVEVKEMTYNATAAHCELSTSQVERILWDGRRKVRAWMCPHLGRDVP
jgi:RNA polymerase sigma factor (sigma-70 family)